MKRLLTLIAVILLLASCGRQDTSLTVVPYPNMVRMHNGTFDATGARLILDPEMDSLSMLAVTDIEKHIGGNPNDRNCTIEFIVDSSLATEAYKIKVSKEKVKVWASGLNGFLYAAQTLRQMLPEIPCCIIEDAPRFAYRGLHLDVARHFFDVPVIKRYIDLMALHKMNTFHWHLTDDQGWRVEIRKYPELTAKGSVRKQTLIGHHHTSNEYDGIPYGGYYAQDEIREVVAYAASKGITIIPEIDLPGHMLAALTAYPHLGCTGGPYELWCKWGVSDDVLCPGKPETFEFVEGVLDEIIELFPSKYIHVGGDECPKVRWEKCPDCQALISTLGLVDDDDHSAEHYLQSHVISRVEKYLNDRGRMIIGWDEILEGGLAPNSTVMSWHGEAGGLEAARQGHDVIMTPNTYYYLDYHQGTDLDREPLGIGGYLPLKKCYSYEPYVGGMTDEEKSHILGVQANLWTEYIKTEEHIHYMLLPRIAALSEVQWCNADRKDYARFLDSMDEICDVYSSLGYNFAGHVFDVECNVMPKEDGGVQAVLSAQGAADIYYTLNGTEPSLESSKYDGPINITSDCTLVANTFRPGVPTYPTIKRFTHHKALGCPVHLLTLPKERYAGGAPVSLTDGVRGGDNFNSAEWSGWQGDPIEVVIDMNGCEEYSSVVLSTIINKPSYLFNPLTIRISVSEDGVDYSEIAYEEYPSESSTDPDGRKEFALSFECVKAPYLKVSALTSRELPVWHPKHGRRVGHLFIDEIIVR